VSDTARDLGVIIDSRLTMADHVAAVCRSCYYQYCCRSCDLSLGRFQQKQLRQ